MVDVRDRIKCVSLFLFVVAGILMSSCIACAIASEKAEETPLQPQRSFSSRFPNKTAFDRFVDQGWDSPFGMDYVFAMHPASRDPELIQEFTDTMRIRWINLVRFTWGDIEKRPPRGGKHDYDWSALDGCVLGWQRHGIHILMSLRFHARWGTARSPHGKSFVYLKGPAKGLALKGGDYLPKAKHEQDWKDYMYSLVERYDGDGIDDMPGLLFPVLYYQIGNEYYNELYWTGTAEEYGILLKEMAQVARRANRDVKIVLTGIGYEDVDGFYQRYPVKKAQEYIDELEPKTPPDMRKFGQRGEEFSLRIMKQCQDYDVLDARWPNYGYVRRSRDYLKSIGCGDKPVWSAEIYSGFPLLEKLILPNWTLQSYPTPSRSLEYIRILKNAKHSKFSEMNRWYRGLHAAHVVKMSLVALDAGSKKLMMGWATDIQSVLSVSTLAYHGLYSATLEKFWPAAHTYNLLIEKLDGLKHVRRLNMPENVFVYECTVKNNDKVLVAFHDDHVGQNHNEPNGTLQTQIPFHKDKAKVTHIITEIDQREPEVEYRDVDNGRMDILLTEFPVFIE